MSNIFHFDGARLNAAPDPLPEGISPDIADSFLLRSGRVRAWHEHHLRFSRDVAKHEPQLASQLDEFLVQSAQLLAGETDAFPRLEVVNGSLWLRIRPVPNLGNEARGVTIPLDVDRAEVKGPNISLYADLNAQHQAETVRLTPEGHILEGVTSAVVWWHDDVLCHPPQRGRVSSTTERAIVGIAVQNGVSVREALITPAQLVEREAWLLNALHGIRPLSELDGVSLPPPRPHRLEQFRADFEASWLPLTAQVTQNPETP